MGYHVGSRPWKDWPTIANVADILPIPKMPAFIIGNSTRRRFFDINQLKGRGLVFGCNRFFESYDFTGYPFFLGCQDEFVGQCLYRTKKEEQKINVLSHESTVTNIFQTGWDKLLFIPRPLMPEFGLTGHALVKFAAIIGCDPIFILGLGDRVERVGSVLSDNLYGNDTYREKEKVRSYATAQSRSEREELFKRDEKIAHWRTSLIEIAKQYRNIYRIAPSGPEEIKSVSWQDILDTLPAQYGVEERKINQLMVYVPTLSP